MAFQAVHTETFPGINLVDDPPEVGYSGAVDLLNVDIDRRGRIRARDGFDNFTSGTIHDRAKQVSAFYATSGTKHLVATIPAAGASEKALIAFNTSGAEVAAQTNGLTAFVYGKGVRFGTPTSERLYFPTATAAGAATYYDGTSFTASTAQLGIHMAVQASDNRLVVANNPTSGPSTVWFSNAGAPETFTAADNVSITPGDGESINALQSWGPYLYAIKDTKLAVFTGNTTDATGGSVFSYQMIDTGVGTTGAACSGRPGVFFLNRRGVYLVAGVSEPRLISRPLDPLFLGNLPDTYSGSAFNDAQVTLADMCWIGERLYVTVPTGASTSNDRILVWDSIRDEWTIWNIPAAGVCGFRKGDDEELHFSYATGSNHLGRVSSEFTTDDGTAIASHYQLGFSDLGMPSQEKIVREYSLWGSGTPTLTVATDYGDPDTGGSVTLGTAPAVAEGWQDIDREGVLFSPKLSASSGAWTVHRLVQHVSHVREPGLRT